MVAAAQKSLEDYLALEYPFHVIADPDGGYVVEFPDLPGCLTQVDALDELPAMVEEARRLWIAAAYEHDMEIPLPSKPEEYSGKFNLRVPRAQHRSLAAGAEREGVSLNQYVVTLLARGDVQYRLERRIEAMERQLAAISEGLHFQVTGVPRTSRRRNGYMEIISGEVVAA